MKKQFSAPYSVSLENYLYETFKLTREDEDPDLVLARSKDLPPIHLSPIEGRHLEILALSCSAKKIVEIGTLGGFSGKYLAKALPPDGHLYTFEKSAQNAEVAKEVFERNHLSKKVSIHVGEALEKLSEIEDQGPFDLVFIDADKGNYPNYFKWAQRNLRRGGLLIADNTLAQGHIADQEIDDKVLRKRVESLREFNHLCAGSEDFTATLIPTGEGLTVAVKLT